MASHGIPLGSHAHKKMQDGSCPKRVVWIPDPHFIEESGFTENIAAIRLSNVHYPKESKIFWRGSTTGKGLECHKLFRFRFAEAARSIAHMDVKLHQNVQVCQDWRQTLIDQRILGEPVSESDWSKNWGVIDITGNVHAWGLFWRLASGCVVFRVQDPADSYCHILEHRLKPWVHYVPVVPEDFQRLGELTLRVLENTTFMTNVIDAAYNLTLEVTLDSEARFAAASIEAMWAASIVSRSWPLFRRITWY